MSIEIGETKARAVVKHEMKAQERGALMTFTRDVRLLLIALWLGAAVFFSFAVAPVLFNVLPARELAGRVVTSVLAIINTGGFVISLVLLASAFIFRHTIKRRAFVAEVASLALITLMTAVGQWIIAARMLALRMAMGKPIDEVAQDAPLRVAFNSLHGYSVTALGLAMLAAAAALLLIARRANLKSV